MQLKETDVEEWLRQQEKRWKCSSCGKKLRWYAESCPKCGTKFFNATQEANTLTNLE
jgi:predicted amidophosphoribosyltransferase